MTRKTGFDNDLYLEQQTEAILERVRGPQEKLYLEFGGKLLYDLHASRVLPGFEPNVKMQLLQRLKDQADVLLCIYAQDIERRKLRADFGISYDFDALKLIDDLRARGVDILGVVVTRFQDQPSVRVFRSKLQSRGIRVFTHHYTKGYPTDIDTIVSDEGYGANEYIETTRPLVVVTGPGPNSGKLATSLSQLYHDYRRGIRAQYAKFETFPVWNLPLKHPVNIAYEAATADIGDFNMVDPFHLEAYGMTAINYNRDVEVFPVLERILEKITGRQSVYRSPTDMGVNRVGFAIRDDQAVREASTQEVIRRYYRYRCEQAMGFVGHDTVQRAELLMKELGVGAEERAVVGPARQGAREAQEKDKGNEGVFVGAAIELAEGRIVTGKNSPLMHASSSLILNAIKTLAGIPDSIHLLSPAIIESIGRFKKEILNAGKLSLDLEETLIALSVSTASNPAAQAAIQKLKDLRGCEMHITHMPTPGDEAGLKRLGVNLTSEPNFSSKDLFLP